MASTRPALDRLPDRVPLLPLSRMTLLPHVLVPLQITEASGVRMIADVLETDRCILLAQTKPGGESDEFSPVYEHACLSRITAEEKLDAGRHSILLEGMLRARILEEEAVDRPYRIARVELRPDIVPEVPTVNRENRRRELIEAVRDLAGRTDLDKLLHEVAEVSVPLGTVCDLITASLPLKPEQVQRFLAEVNVDLRSDLALEQLRELRRCARQTGKQAIVPPGFSVN